MVKLKQDQTNNISKSKIQDVDTFQLTLYDKILSLFKSLGIDETTVQQFNMNMISVNIGNNDQPNAFVECILCIVEKRKCKKEKLSVRCKSSGNNHYWVLSNLKKHIQRHATQLKKYANTKTDRKRKEKSIQLLENDEESTFDEVIPFYHFNVLAYKIQRLFVFIQNALALKKNYFFLMS